MSDHAKGNSRAAILIIAPAVMLVGFFYHPHIGSPRDVDFLIRLAGAVVADPLRWAVSHLMLAVGSGLIVLAFLALRGRLREEGEERWSRPAVPFIVMGSVLYALLPAMEFAPLAVARTGADTETIAATQGALFTWMLPVLMTGALLFLIGAVGFAVAIVRGAILRAPLAGLVVVSLVAMAVARFVPLAALQLHVQGVLGVIALWPLAYAMLKYPRSPSPHSETAAPHAGTAPAVPR